jgi:hypothetical protein
MPAADPALAAFLCLLYRDQPDLFRREPPLPDFDLAVALRALDTADKVRLPHTGRPQATFADCAAAAELPSPALAPEPLPPGLSPDTPAWQYWHRPDALRGLATGSEHAEHGGCLRARQLAQELPEWSAQQLVEGSGYHRARQLVAQWLAWGHIEQCGRRCGQPLYRWCASDHKVQS